MSPSFNSLGNRSAFAPGATPTIFDVKDKGYNVWAFVYDAANTRALIYLNDVPIAGAVTTPTAAKLRGVFMSFAGASLSAQSYWNSGAYYNSALTTAQLTTASTVLKARAVSNGLTVDPTSRFIFFEGDSNTDGSAGVAPGGTSYPFLYAPNATAAFHGVAYGQSGNKLADMVARAPLLDRIPVAGSRKFILSGMIGTNDGSLVFTSDAATYSANLLAYWAARKAAGFITVGIGCVNRTDANAAVGFDTWRKAINTNLRNAVGVQLDAFVDVEADPNIGATLAPDNTTYFKTDKVHLTLGTGTTGQAALEVLYRAAVNPLL